MNSKIEKLLNEQTKNNTKIEDYKERITVLQNSIKKLNARNREIDSEIESLNDELLLAEIKDAGFASPDEFRKLILSLKETARNQ
jgi:chromosome segregation ATPase